MESCDLFIVGGGAAGLSAARSAAQQGVKSILLVDRMAAPGGILRQCIHRGFGQDLTGPEYITGLLDDFEKNVRFLWNTTVICVDENRTAVLSSPDFGMKEIRFRQMILASGCREIPAGSLDIGGTRPGGVYTAGEMQQRMNLRGLVPEGPAVILGSGDVGLTMAWQLLSSGVEVKMLVEKKMQCGGLARNWKRLEGYRLPVRTGSGISELFGENYLEGVRIRNLNTGEEEIVSCRTLVVAVGLVPEQALIQKIGPQPWLQLCGNSSRIHTVVESVVQEGKQAGITACEKLRIEL